jgi:hypothetical protein
MGSKRQTTMAKMARERAVKEKREKKREKKAAAAEARALAAQGIFPEQEPGEEGELLSGEQPAEGELPPENAEDPEAFQK